MTADLYPRAAALIAANRWADAAREIAPALAADPSADVLELAAEVSLHFGAYAEACELARRATAALHAPLAAHAAVRTAQLLRRLELAPELEKLFATQAVLGWPATLAAEMAVLASSASLFDQAAAISTRLLAAAPADPNAHYVAGLLAMFDGDRDRSLSHLGRALAIEPRMGNAHWLVAMQDEPAGAAAHVELMRKAMSGVVPGSEAEAYFRYSLHRRLHDLRRYPEAWDELAAGWATQRRLEPYDIERDMQLFDALHRVQVESDGAAPQPGEPRVIFIVGMFRSGTSLIERVLTSHPDVVDGGETYQFTAAFRQAADSDGHGPIDLELVRRAAAVDFEQVRERFMRYARWRVGGRGVLTEKLPSNFLNIPYILRAMPDATVVHLRRDPIDTCFSNLRTYFRGAAPYANAPDDMARYYVAYERLMTHLCQQAPGRIVEVDYESFVGDADAGSRSLLEACGLDRVAENQVARDHRSTTASAADLGKGILRGRGGAWRPYAAQLKDLREVLDSATR
ncbi:tetratricopeptide repeat-containing sulfotransferase family protein [Lysobacter sp. HA18]